MDVCSFTAPPVLDNQQNKSESWKHVITQNTIYIDVKVEFFKNEINGRQRLFGIAVCAVSNCHGDY